MDTKAAKHREKMERKNQQKEEMKMWRDKLDEVANDERREQLAFPSTLNKGQRKRLHTYAHSIGLKSKSHGTGKIAGIFAASFGNRSINILCDGMFFVSILPSALSHQPNQAMIDF